MERKNQRLHARRKCRSHLLRAFLISYNSFDMINKKNEHETISFAVTEGLTVTILPSLNHEFLMDMKEVSKGYGTTEYAVRQSKIRNESELIEGKHYVTAVTIRHSDSKVPHNKVFWTKRGVIRLGFFIKSERAKLFRNWAEELVLYRTELKQPTLFDVPPIHKLPKVRNHNRLTQDRLLSIMADVCRIDDRDLRLSLSTKLMQGGVQC